MNTTHNGIDFVRAAILEHRAAQAAAAAQVTCTGCKIPRYPRRFVLSPPASDFAQRIAHTKEKENVRVVRRVGYWRVGSRFRERQPTCGHVPSSINGVDVNKQQTKQWRSGREERTK